MRCLADLFDGGDGLGHGRRLLAHAGGLLSRAGEDLRAGRAEPVDGLADFLEQPFAPFAPPGLVLDQRSDIRGHRVERRAQGGQLVATDHADRRGEVAPGQLVGGVQQRSRALVDAPDHPELAQHHQHDRGGEGVVDPLDLAHVLVRDPTGEIDPLVDPLDLGIGRILDPCKVLGRALTGGRDREVIGQERPDLLLPVVLAHPVSLDQTRVGGPVDPQGGVAVAHQHEPLVELAHQLIEGRAEPLPGVGFGGIDQAVRQIERPHVPHPVAGRVIDPDAVVPRQREHVLAGDDVERCQGDHRDRQDAELGAQGAPPGYRRRGGGHGLGKLRRTVR